VPSSVRPSPGERKCGCRVGNGAREGLGATHTGRPRRSLSASVAAHPASVSTPGPSTSTGEAAASRAAMMSSMPASDSTGDADTERDASPAETRSSAGRAQSSSGTDT